MSARTPAAGRPLLVAGLLALATAGAAIGSFLVGHYPLSAGQVLRVLWSQAFGGPADWPAATTQVVLHVRLPRIAAALLVGAALASAGAAYQALFRNPLVSPALLGVSAGAGFGASLALLLQWPAAWVQACAFGFGILAVGIATGLARRLGGDSPIVLVLAGMVVAAVFQALLSGVKYVADPVDALPAITFWLLGSMARVTTQDVVVALLPIALGLLVLHLLRWRIDLASISDDEIHTLGVRVSRLRAAVIVAATLLTAAAVSISGIVGWVGLLVPHMARMLVGPAFAVLLPASALLGGVFLLLVDDVCRGATASEVPLGILTALIGAPVFLVLLARTRHRWS
ncbi:MAG: iron ABC transporter permease [Rubrivivax sp.]